MGSRTHVFVGEFCLLVLLLSSFLGFAHVRADQNQQQVPAPQIQRLTPEGEEGYSIMVIQGPDFAHSNSAVDFGARKLSDANNSLSMMWQGDIHSYVGGTLYNFQYYLSSPAYLDSYTFSVGSQPQQIARALGVYINCSDELIPICLCNCSSFDMVTSDITYVDNGTVPTFTNTVTFRDIPLETYGNGESLVTVVFTQHFICDWTQLTIKTDVYADFTKLKLYFGNQSEVPHYTKFSLNFDYVVGLSEQSSNSSSNIPPSEITSTAVYFNVNDTEKMHISVANMTLGDAYDELQGNTLVPGNSTAYFAPVYAPKGGIYATCVQTFSDLTYGLTTGVKSDPTIQVQHDRGSVSGDTGPIVLVTVGTATVAVLIIVVAVVHNRKKKALTNARTDETQKQAENENPGLTSQ